MTIKPLPSSARPHLYATQPLRYWRCQIVDQNPSGYVQVGGMFLGVGYEMAQGSVQFPLQLEESDLTQLSSSEGGQVFADILPKSATFSLNLNALSVADVEEVRDIFDRYGTGSPFYVVMDTSAIWNSTDNQVDQVRHVRRGASLRASVH
jgi:hypothetical protein